MIKVLYEDTDIVVCVKPPGVLSQEGSEENMVSLLREEREYIAVVHRLDRGVGGVMVYAKTPHAAASLARQIRDRTMKKEYLAGVRGRMEQTEGIFEDILFKDSAKNKSFVVKTMRKGAKKASLAFRVTAKTEDRALVRVLLHTGRTHQIRVQFASRKHPLCGDGKYGAKDNLKLPALWSRELRFLHPRSGKQLCFAELPAYEGIWKEFPQEAFADGKEIE